MLGLLLWLYKAHALEFLGHAVFQDVWVCSLIFQGINSVLIGLIAQDIRSHTLEAITNCNVSDKLTDNFFSLHTKKRKES